MKRFAAALLTVLAIGIAGPAGAAGEESLEETNRELDNPLTSRWSLTFEDKYRIQGGEALFAFPRPRTIGTLVQHWWSCAGADDRGDINQTDIQYVVRHALPKAWSVGMGPTISIDWEADDDDRWTVPVGLGLTKTVRFGKTPAKFRDEVHYALIRPDTFGTEWTFPFRAAPVIRSPFL